jgi:hypothetical protein
MRWAIVGLFILCACGEPCVDVDTAQLRRPVPGSDCEAYRLDGARWPWRIVGESEAVVPLAFAAGTSWNLAANRQLFTADLSGRKPLVRFVDATQEEIEVAFATRGTSALTVTSIAIEECAYAGGIIRTLPSFWWKSDDEQQAELESELGHLLGFLDDDVEHACATSTGRIAVVTK